MQALRLHYFFKQMRTKTVLLLIILCFSNKIFSAKILIPMDNTQKDHLKAYGIAYWVLTFDKEVEWLLNYRGGSFMFDNYDKFEKECLLRGVSYQKISESSAAEIYEEIANPAINMEVVKLLKAPKIAVYSPKSKQPWDDAVTLVLTYSEIPYTTIFDDEVMDGKLVQYDWLHLHHEDFTGQYGKFWASYHQTQWYKDQVAEAEAVAAKYGFKKVSQLKLAVVKKIRDFTIGGGFLFAMCSATDSYDIALTADGVDICESMFDGDGMDPNAQSKLNYDNSFAFKDFKLEVNPWAYEISNIDMQQFERNISEENDYFVLFDFSAKFDFVPTMLCQNHEKVIKGFMGQTTAFRKSLIKSDVLIMGQNQAMNEARYIHGEIGKGTWTFYGGHDPEDYQHFIEEPPTELSLHPNSPGYRLILNNILFPSAKKKKQKT